MMISQKKNRRAVLNYSCFLLLEGMEIIINDDDLTANLYYYGYYLTNTSITK